MPLVVKDRVRQTTTTTGTGTVTLNGTVVGFQSFSVIGDGNTTYYAIVDAATGDWEVGIGTYTLSGTTLSRDTVLESSNSGGLVPFAAGTKDVFCTYPAERSVYSDGTNIVPASAATLLTTSGGTGLSSYTAGDLPYYATGTALSKLTIGTSGNWLGSSGTAPQWNAPAALTKTDDTNVTLTLGGSASTALLNAASLTLGWTGQLATTRGGTGLTSFTTNQVFYASSTSAIGQSANLTFDGTTLTANTLTVSTGATTVPAGTVSAPAITTSGDTNTGIYFPAADTVAIGTGGTERLRVDSAGNAGLATTSISTAVWGSTYPKLAIGTTTNAGVLQFESTAAAANNKYLGGVSALNLGSGVTANESADILFYQDGTSATNPGGRISFFTRTDAGSVTEKMRLNASGNLGIGTTSPQGVVDLGSGTDGRALTWGGSAGTARYASIFTAYSSAALVLATDFHGSNSADSYITSWTGTAAANAIRLNLVGTNGIQFFTDAPASKTAGNAFTPTERARIDSSGVLNVFMTGAETGVVNGYQLLSPAGAGGLTIYSSAATRDQIQLKDGVTTGPASGNTCAFGVSAGALYAKTGGSERMRIDSSGNINIATAGARITGDFSNGTIANRVMFQTSSAGSNSVISAIPNGAATQASFIAAGNSDPTNASYIQMLANGTTDTRLVSTYFGTGTYLPMTFYTGGSERMRITSDGAVCIGATSASSALTKTIELSSAGTGTSQPAYQVYSYPGTSAANTGYFEFYRSRGASVATNTIVASGDRLGMVRFNGANGTTYNPAAEIYGEVDGTPGATNDMPGRIVFATTADGAGSTTERMRITSDGEVLVGGGTTTPVIAASQLEVNNGSASIVSIGPIGGGSVAGVILSRNDTTIASGNPFGRIGWAGNDTTSNAYTYHAYIDAVASGTHAAGDNPTDLVFGTTPDGTETVAEAGRITQSGAYVLKGGTTTAAAGVGVIFPATQVASADANCLDDYEEGTFTPTIVGTTVAGTGTYTTQIGKYTKIGNVVYIQAAIVWTAHTGTGNMRIGAFPFTSGAGATNGFGHFSFYVSNIALNANNYMQPIQMNGSSTTAQFIQGPIGGGAAASVAMDTAGEIYISGSYFV